MSERELLRIDTDDEIMKIIQRLDSLGDQLDSPRVLAKAMNQTAREFRTKLKKYHKKYYAVTDQDVLERKDYGAVQVKNASGENIDSTLLSRGPMLDLMKFMVKGGTGNAAVAAKVINSHSLVSLEKGNLKAFVATFASGHVAVVQRDPPKKYKSTGASARLAAQKEAGRNWPPDMTKVKKLLGPAMPIMYGNIVEEYGMMNDQELVYTTLRKYIDKEINRILSK